LRRRATELSRVVALSGYPVASREPATRSPARPRSAARRTREESWRLISESGMLFTYFENADFASPAARFV
jgi:hypothetical protein